MVLPGCMSSTHIFVVEDDDAIRNLCVEVLEVEGFKVDAYANGKEAIAALEKHSEPCLILLDMMMPVMNGRDFMSAFAQRPHTLVPIPVYLVSASALEGEGKQMGCYGFLKKPFSIDALLAIVHSHCKIQDKQRLD
jgi:CheY-like chemotaxis protein